MRKGVVYLVGAGPGDPGLITVAGLDRIREADVIVYDRLISERLLDYARADAELIYVGKVPGQVSGADVSHDQDAINQILADKAREGRRVVRLKGGDPFVFGRGGEEAEALRAAGIPFEIVPGVTSAVAVPAYAGIPVTHRGVAASFAVITGHEEPGKPESAIDWPHLATAVDTLVFLMGVKKLPEIVANLVANGRPETTPVAVIRWGTTPEQSTVTGTLADIAERVAEAGLTPPAITIVGEVVRLRETLSWFESRPLFGKRVLITRTRRQASNLARLLAAQGAIPVELPAIEIEPVADTTPLSAAIDRLRDGGYAWCGFTSANAVELTFEHLAERSLDARSFGGTRVFAIGPATADALRSHGITADVVPDEYVAEAVVEAMRAHVSEGDAVLLPRAESARAELVSGLEAMGATVDEIAVYRAAVPSEPDPKTLASIREGRIDIVTFTSSSTVRNLLAILGPDAAALKGESRPLIACIGPITAE
ncbi:MAG: uroporphyrinogen-III C-methyltransferase, partial [Chloroflexi bacterium]|nr:uroporphyrinogen-III C-methyltransferase [Chloroflexota bacterium]